MTEATHPQRDEIRVAIADDHPLMRSGIRSTLERGEDIEIVGEAIDAQGALELCETEQPDVLLLDLSMPGPSPLTLLKQVRAVAPDTNVIIVTAYDDAVYVRGVIDAGVAGYVLKDETSEALVSAVRAVNQGGTWFSRSVFSKLRQAGAKQDELTTLTPRERDVLELVAQGKSNVGISEELDLAKQTVRNYVSQIYDKLNLNSRVELAVWARERGFGRNS